jgi:methylmalonyl-CoA mutase cobalamin-binding domain/chain
LSIREKESQVAAKNLKKEKEMAEQEALKGLRELVLAFDEEGVGKGIQDAFKEGFSAQEILNELSMGMEAIGEKFQNGEFFLPELVWSAEIMKSALGILQPRMTKADGVRGKTVVLASPRGDIHDIGKNIVGGLLTANGFEVHDLGIDVAPEEIAKKADEVNADIVGLSALISGAVSSMAETIILLNEKKSRAKVIIGGAATTPEAAKTIGADAYAKDAWEGFEIIKGWI